VVLSNLQQPGQRAGVLGDFLTTSTSFVETTTTEGTFMMPVPTTTAAAAATTTTTITINDIPRDNMSRLLKIFWNGHFAVELCRFMHRGTFEAQLSESVNAFLLSAIVSLSALYIFDDEVREMMLGFTTARAFSDHFVVQSRRYSRDTSDEPLGKSRFSLFFSSDHDPSELGFRVTGINLSNGLQSVDVRWISHPNGAGSPTQERIQWISLSCESRKTATDLLGMCHA
jgi:hypothetical protein